MKALVLAFLLSISTYIGFAPSGAMAGCGTQMNTACDVQRVQADMPDFVGKQKVTTDEMACLSVVASAPTELVLAQGEVAEGAAVDGRVITSWRVQKDLWKLGSDGLYRREICMMISQMADVMTLCNKENRSVWHASDVAMLRRMKRIPANDPACVMGDAACAAIGL